MKREKLLLVLLVVVAVVIFVDPVYAGPGGVIAKGLFKTWYGKLLMFVLALILLPLIIYMKTREFFAVRKNKKELLELSRINNDFSWTNVHKQVKNVFERVYLAWANENMEEVAEYVTPWYWRNQQLIYLDQWKENNQKNICKLKKVENIKPLYLEISNNEKLDGSKIAFSITAEVEDYLIDRTTRKVVYGKPGFDSEEKIWVMEYNAGNWVLDNIEDGAMSLAFARTPNYIPSGLIQAK